MTTAPVSSLPAFPAFPVVPTLQPDPERYRCGIRVWADAIIRNQRAQASEQASQPAHQQQQPAA